MTDLRTFLPIADAAIFPPPGHQISKIVAALQHGLPKLAIQLGKIAPFPNRPFAARVPGVSHAENPDIEN